MKNGETIRYCLDPYDRAMVRFWAKFVHEKILPTARKTIVAQGKEQEQIIEEVQQQLKLLENELKRKNFFGGENIGYLDIVAFCLANGFRANQEALQMELITEEKFPALWKWVGKLLEIGVVNECLPPREKHIAFIRARIEAAKSASK